MTNPREIQKRKTEIRVAVVDDNSSVAKVIAQYVKQTGCKPSVSCNPTEFVSNFQPDDFEIVITDIRMPETDGFAVLEKVKRVSPHTEVIVFSAHAEKSDAIRALKMGAFDFFEKPVKHQELEVALQKTLAFRQMAKERDEMAADLAATSSSNIKKWGIDNFIGSSPSLNSIKKLVRSACAVKASVLITGESGTGKELVARMLHYGGPRAPKPFVPVNCSAMPPELAESLLFGHVKGAFTGAAASAKGYFETADKGTIFLDEIGDMQYELQAKLLRVLEDGMIAKVGKAEGVPVDVRVVAATNADLQGKVRNKEFREDLFYRLNTLIIRIPPLRERRDDIPQIVNHLIQLTSREMGRSAPSIDEDALAELSRLQWPGNVRQLKNSVERALILKASGSLTREDFADDIDSHRPSYLATEASGALSSGPSAVEPGDLNLERIQVQAVKTALSLTDNNVSEAARLLGISRNRLYRLLGKQ